MITQMKPTHIIELTLLITSIQISPAAWVTNEEGGKDYFLSPKELSFVDARSFCTDLHAHLATPTNEQENSFVAQMTSSSTSHIWLGIQKDRLLNRDWKYISNGEVTWTNWEEDDTGHASHHTNEHNKYAVIEPGGDGKWESWDDDVSKKALAVCQKDSQKTKSYSNEEDEKEKEEKQRRFQVSVIVGMVILTVLACTCISCTQTISGNKHTVNAPSVKGKKRKKPFKRKKKKKKKKHVGGHVIEEEKDGESEIDDESESESEIESQRKKGSIIEAAKDLRRKMIFKKYKERHGKTLTPENLNEIDLASSSTDTVIFERVEKNTSFSKKSHPPRGQSVKGQPQKGQSLKDQPQKGKSLKVQPQKESMEIPPPRGQRNSSAVNTPRSSYVPRWERNRKDSEQRKSSYFPGSRAQRHRSTYYIDENNEFFFA